MTEKLKTTIKQMIDLLGLPKNDEDRIYLIIQYIEKKEKLSIEDVRRQLGERLPGIFDALCRAYGKNMRETHEDMKQGKVSVDYLEKAIYILKKDYRLN